MSFKDLVEPDCGGANPLMNLGSQVTRDRAYQDEGFSGRSGFIGGENDFVNEFMGQMAPAPQSFRMDVLLKEMREIDAHNFHQSQIVSAPPVIQQVNQDHEWAKEYASASSFQQQQPPISESKLTSIWTQSQFAPIESAGEQPTNILWTREFFEINDPQSMGAASIQETAGHLADVADAQESERLNYSEFLKFINNVSEGNIKIEDGQASKNNVWASEFQEITAGASKATEENINAEDWVKAFEEGKPADSEMTENYNKQFWERLQDEWRKISEDGENQHPWLSEYSDFYDAYKEYKFDEENPMIDIENAFEKGKAFLEKDDIPSAVLCFESAVKQDPNNPEIWELLGLSQAENERDPNAIAALNKALQFNPNNMQVLMALAVSYTNESMQNQALKMLVKWMKCNPKYEKLVPPQMVQAQDSPLASSIIGGPQLKEVQELFLQAVHRSTEIVDADIQEALGVLFNLSSEYDKAVDCFRAALQIRPDSSKIWNRLGASLANGNRSVEAVEAYQRALELQPGFIRVRYNVGIICINLKAYKEAVEHFLTALNHQASSIGRSGMNVTTPANQMSSTIWSTLRMVISLMGRHELQSAIDNRDLNSLNKEFPMSNEE